MNVGLYLYDGYFETEVAPAMIMFRGERLITISDNSDIAVCAAGKKVMIDKKVGEVDPNEIDVLILPGGMEHTISEETGRFIKACADNGAVVGGICGGVDFMASAGVLSKKRYTSYYDPEKQYQHLPKDAKLTYSMYECDDNIITARAEAYLEFAFALYQSAGFTVDVDNYAEWFKTPLSWQG